MWVRKGLSPLKHRALHNLSMLPAKINLSKQPILVRDMDFKCMCNCIAFKRRDNETLSMQRLISGSVSIAPVLLPESVRRDGHLGKVVLLMLTPFGMDPMYLTF